MDLVPAIILAAVVSIGSGLSLRKLHERRVERHCARLEDRLKAGQDRYFEELRELQAYDPRTNPPWKNIALELLALASIFAGFLTLLLNLDF
ncbi:hypothetical protein SAMN06297468_2980 [Altererythrobacter xiamenensis]|uniref:Uncharacterized protein n=1 Tax=Altererythrobacter xiamenensis TaxID=1316679 RepID=A0A1Y6FM34_9SPHN|nr:hypothetical protein [Altererythrobacter xiamenensis]SMQ75829.1 hypothetical protein SAMN06297468_2980 [Altererythrobacter xiamenensis]